MKDKHDAPLWIEKPSPKVMGDEFRKVFESGFVMIPGAHDPMAALLAKDAGFEALYLSGGALSASLGLPDIGLLTMEELITRARAIVRASDLPLLVDGDTGYGEAINVMRLIRELEDAGAAAVQIEDRVLPKKCGHLNGKQLVSVDDMAAKIAAAARARSHLVIVARTDATATEGLEAAIARAKRYVEAGADVIFPEALPGPEAFSSFVDSLDVPVLGNMTEFGKTPQMSAGDFEALGVQMAIWPVSSLRVASRAVQKFYGTLKAAGSAKSTLDDMQTRGELYETIRYYDYEALDERIQKTLLPEVGKH